METSANNPPPSRVFLHLTTLVMTKADEEATLGMAPVVSPLGVVPAAARLSHLERKDTCLWVSHLDAR